MVLDDVRRRLFGVVVPTATACEVGIESGRSNWSGRMACLQDTPPIVYSHIIGEWVVGENGGDFGGVCAAWSRDGRQAQYRTWRVEEETREPIAPSLGEIL